MVAFEFSGTVYSVSEAQATLLAEALRGYAKGKLPDEAEARGRAERQSPLGRGRARGGRLHRGDPGRAISKAPLPLEGKAAEATFWTLRMMELESTGEAADTCTLRDALGLRFGALQS